MRVSDTHVGELINSFEGPNPSLSAKERKWALLIQRPSTCNRSPWAITPQVTVPVSKLTPVYLARPTLGRDLYKNFDSHGSHNACEQAFDNAFDEGLCMSQPLAKIVE